MQAAALTIAVIDFETTGPVAGYPDEPWQVGLVRLEQGRVVPESAWTSLLRVGDRPFNPFAPGRHAEVRGALAVAPTLTDVWPALQSQLDGRMPLAAHHAATEKRVLLRAFPMCGAAARWIDTLKLYRLAMPGLNSYRLGDLIGRLQLAERVAALVPGGQAHDALYDAAACAVLLEHLLADPQWGTMDAARFRAL